MTKQEQIYADINAALQSELSAPSDTLSDLEADVDAGNQVAEHRIWTKIFAFASYILEQLFQKHKEEVNAIAERPKLYSREWIQQIGLDYRHGDSLTYSNGYYVWSDGSINPLLAHCSISMSGSLLLIKAAKSGPAPLTTSEKDGLSGYLEKMLYPGTHYTVISQAADDLIYDITIYRNASVMDDSGALIAEPGTKPVENAINDYISNIPFNSVFNRNAFIDAIQNAQGVNDVVVNNLQYRYGSLSYQDVGRQVTSMAGYYAVDANSNINYV